MSFPMCLFLSNYKNNKLVIREVWDLNLKQSREILFIDKIKVSLEVKVEWNKI